jgi:hypothetical protein
MDDVYKLNASQLSKKLQTYPLYQYKSQKQIKEMIGNTSALRDEVLRLEKSDENIKESTYIVRGKEYTEDELAMMIDFYHKHTQNKYDKLDVSDALPDDVLNLILQQSDIKEIINYCNTKKYNHICNSDQFWKTIFKRDGLPIHDNPTNSKEWINLYKKTLDANIEAFVLTTLDYAITAGVYDITINGKFDSYFRKYADFIPKINNIYTNISKSGVTIYNSTASEKKVMTKDEFKQLLADILYFYPDVKIESPTGTKNIPLRKKDILPLAAKTGYKTVANKIVYHYKLKEPQYAK